jgi:anti-sigma factor ChrR (cupin superfamily)
MANSKLISKRVPRQPEVDVLPDALTQQLLTALVVKPMPMKRSAAVKKSVLTAIAKAIKDESKTATVGNNVKVKAAVQTTSRGIVTTRAGEGVWHALCAGVEVQTVSDDGHTLTWLARFGPGGRLPAHDHVGEEESFVLHGACYLGDQLLNQGDRQLAVDGSRHREVYSPEGCTLLIRSASRATPHYLSVLSGRAA